MTEWIISSSVLIIIIVALRFILRGKISMRLRYALWMLVLLRLLAPFTIYNSPVSVMNALPEEFPAEKLSALLSAGTPEGEYTAPAPARPVRDALEGAEGAVVSVDAVTNAEAKGVGRGLSARLVWLSGTAVVGACFVISNFRLYFRLRRSRREYAGGQDAPLKVFVSGAVETPCLFGLFRPAIYVTDEASADALTFRHVLEHERAHYRHLDHIWSALRGVCLALHWYNPLVWLAAALSRRDAELCCDEAVIKRIGEERRAEYGRTLIGLTCTRSRPSDLLCAATTMTGGKRSIKERVRLIANGSKTAAYTLVIVLILAAFAAGCTFTGAEKTLTGEPVFERLDEVESISIYDASELADVPRGSEYFDELLEWIGGFTYGEMLSEEEGGNTGGCEVLVKYPDETLSSGVDIRATERGEYRVLRPEYPECWDAALAGAETAAALTAYSSVTSGGVTVAAYENPLYSARTSDSDINAGKYLTAERVAEIAELIPSLTLRGELNIGPQGSAPVALTLYDAEYAYIGFFVDLTNQLLLDEGAYYCGFTINMVGTGSGTGTYEYIFRLLVDGESQQKPTPEEIVDGGGARTLGYFDLNADGEAEEVLLDLTEWEEYGQAYVRVLDAEGNELWSDGAGAAHAGWNSIYLCRWDRRCYLLRWNPVMYQGRGSCGYSLFALSDGAEYEIKANSVEFDPSNVSPEKARELMDFASEVNSLLFYDCVLLLTTQDGALDYCPAGSRTYFAPLDQLATADLIEFFGASDGGYAEAAQAALTERLLAKPEATLYELGRAETPLRDRLCWYMAYDCGERFPDELAEILSLELKDPKAAEARDVMEFCVGKEWREVEGKLG